MIQEKINQMNESDVVIVGVTSLRLSIMLLYFCDGMGKSVFVILKPSTII